MADELSILGTLRKRLLTLVFSEYLVVHNVEDAITATANAGPRGTAGTFLFDLARYD